MINQHVLWRRRRAVKHAGTSGHVVSQGHSHSSKPSSVLAISPEVRGDLDEIQPSEDNFNFFEDELSLSAGLFALAPAGAKRHRPRYPRKSPLSGRGSAVAGFAALLVSTFLIIVGSGVVGKPVAGSLDIGGSHRGPTGGVAGTDSSIVQAQLPPSAPGSAQTASSPGAGSTGSTGYSIGSIGVGNPSTSQQSSGSNTGSSSAPAPTTPLPPTPTPPPPAPTNLLSNPSFEANMTGWEAWQGTLTQVQLAGAPDGSSVAQVSPTGGATAYSIDSAANGGVQATGGVKYTATAWVAAASPSSVGKKVQIVLRERGGIATPVENDSDNVQSAGSTWITLTSSFQQVTVSLTNKNSGDLLDVYVQQSSAVAGNSFYADAFTLTHS